MLCYTLNHIQINKNILNDEKYNLLYTVEAVNQLVLDGLSFRDAYSKIAEQTADGMFSKPEKMKYTHEGSIGSLCNDKIQQQMKNVCSEFNFEKTEQAVRHLLDDK